MRHEGLYTGMGRRHGALNAWRVTLERRSASLWKPRAWQPLLSSYPSRRAAGALGVEPAYFLDGGAVRRRKPGPPSELELRIERLRKLPRSKQDMILAMLDAALEQAGAR